MSAFNLDEIKARWAAATPGPWEFDPDEEGSGCNEVYYGLMCLANNNRTMLHVHVQKHYPGSEALGTFIAHAPTDIDALVTEVERLKRIEFERRLDLVDAHNGWEAAVEETRCLGAEVDRITEENKRLWAVFKTCHGCKHLIPGIMLGCPSQSYIDISGNCNQKEEKCVNMSL